MTLVFGRDSVCRHCLGKGGSCQFCRGTGLSSGPQAPVRRDSPDTSVAAAASISSEAIRTSQAFILRILQRHGPLTDEQIYRAIRNVYRTEMSPSGARTRRSELVRLGKVEDSGRTEVLASGRKAIRWKAVK